MEGDDTLVNVLKPWSKPNLDCLDMVSGCGNQLWSIQDDITSCGQCPQRRNVVLHSTPPAVTLGGADRGRDSDYAKRDEIPTKKSWEESHANCTKT